MDIKIILVEDHELTRKGIIYALKPYNNIQILGEFEDGKQAVEFIKSAEPDNTPNVVLMDIAMPVLNGIDATKRIKNLNLDIKVIMLTSIDERESVLKAFSSGANAYAMKNISIEKLVSIIKMVLNGEVWIAQNIADYILDVLLKLNNDKQNNNKNISIDEPANNFNLTNREKEILGLIAKGMSNKDIANKLIISLYTVKNHVKSIIQKLAVEDRTQAAILALTEKII